MSTQKHQGQHQEQGVQKQEQKQGPPPDPVAEQQKTYKAPENAIASDPITRIEAPEPPKQTQEQKQ